MAKGLILALATMAATAPVAAQLTGQLDLAKAERPVPGAGEAMVVLRVTAASMVGDNRILLYRYDPATRALVPGADGKPQGARITFRYSLFGGKKGEAALRVAIVPAGTYVLAGRTFNANYTDVFCFGAPRFTLTAGEIVYLGDYQMFALAKMPDRESRNAMRYGADLTATRTALAAAYPTLAPRLAAWRPVNGATFRCVGDEFTAYAVPGAPGG